MPVTTLTIGSDSYNPTQRGDAGIALSRLDLHWEQADELTWVMYGCGPDPQYKTGLEVTLSYGSTLVFRGNLLDTQPGGTGELAWVYSCRALGLLNRADWVTITGQAGTGQAVYNRSPTDLLFVASDAGLTLGTIIKRVLTIQENADRLSAVGIGAYTTLSPPTLPASTLADLLLMDVVPQSMVIFQGHGILNHIMQEMGLWCPRFGMRVQADGTIRFVDLFAMTRYVATLPTESAAGDDIEASISESTAGCFTAWKYIGVNIQPALLSVRDGTLKPNWTTSGGGNDQAAWRYTQFTQSNDRAIFGNITALTSTSATLSPSSTTAAFGANTLGAMQAQIYVINTAATGIQLEEFRYVTTNTALVAGSGSSFTVGWDSSMPLDATGYNKFHLVALAGGLNEVWRGYLACEPSSGAVGLSTYIGSHLVPRFPRPISFANNGKIDTITTPVGKVLWSTSGNAPYNEFPLAVEIDNSIGGVRFNEPVVKATVTGGISFLTTTGSPTSFAEGLPWDVQVIVPYNRGGMEARVPTTSYRGTAYTVNGIQREMEIHADQWNWIGDRPDIIKLADEHLKTVQDVVNTGSIGWYGLPTAFSPWELGFAVDLVYPGPSSTTLKRFDNMPVRDISIAWDRPGIDFYVTLSVSNLRRPFQGDSLYLHPAFGGASPLDMQGSEGFGEWNTFVFDRMARGPIVPDRAVMSVGMETIGMAQDGAMLPDPTAGLPSGPPTHGGIGNAGRANPVDSGSAMGPHAMAFGPGVTSRPRDTLDLTPSPEPRRNTPASGVGAHPAQMNPDSAAPAVGPRLNLIEGGRNMEREFDRGGPGGKAFGPNWDPTNPGNSGELQLSEPRPIQAVPPMPDPTSTVTFDASQSLPDELDA